MNDIKKLLIAAVCVVLVVAIAAGVSIGVMANTMNGLKDRVSTLEAADEAQAAQNAAMKADIEKALAGGEDLITAEEFENKLADALGKNTETMQSMIATAVANQIEDLDVAGLTEEQVNDIIAVAVENCLTEDEINEIIAGADTGLSKSEVKKLINEATYGYLTYAQISALVEDGDYALKKKLEKQIKALADELGVKLDEIEDNLGNLGDDFDYSEQESYIIEGTTVKIGTPKALIEWAASVNDGDDYKNYTVELTADIDLDGHEWAPINEVNGNLAGTTFDGKGYTISNMTAKDGVEVSGIVVSGFFGKVTAIKVIDVTFEDAYVNSGDTASDVDAYAAVVVAHVYNSNACVFEDITVTGATVVGNDKCGGVIGFLNEYTIVLKNITVTDSEIGSGNADAAGEIVGRTGVQLIFAGCEVDGVACVATYANGFVGKGPAPIVSASENIELVTPAELATVMTPVSGTITLDKDYVVSGDWVSISVSGDIVIDGNGHTISNLNKPLVAGNVTRSLTIKNLTIADSEIGPAANENGLGTGAFVCYSDAVGTTITFENCHLVDSTVTSNYRAGGFVGYTAGAEIVITDCSVVNCEITGEGGAAGFVSFTSKNTTITDSSVESTEITATEDRLGTKAATAGTIVGSANVDAVLTFDNVESIENTVSNNNSLAAYSELIGRLVGNATVVIK